MAKPKANRRSIVGVAATFISATLFMFGAQSMSTVDILGPWLMAIGVLVAASAIFVSEEVWQFIGKKHVLTKIVIWATLCAITTVPTYLFFHNVVNQQVDKMAANAIYYGRIVIGDEPIPVSDVPTGAVTVMLGDKVAVFMRKDQTYILANQDTPLISLGFDAQGGMLINATVYDHEHREIVGVENNVFFSDKRFGVYPYQPNYHTLLVNDSSGNQLLNINYMNANIIRISGKFYIPGYRDPLIVTPDSNIHFDGLYVSDTKPFRFDIMPSRVNGFLNVTSKGGLSFAGRVIGEGTAR